MLTPAEQLRAHWAAPSSSPTCRLCGFILWSPRVSVYLSPPGACFCLSCGERIRSSPTFAAEHVLDGAAIHARVPPLAGVLLRALAPAARVYPPACRGPTKAAWAALSASYLILGWKPSALTCVVSLTQAGHLVRESIPQ